MDDVQAARAVKPNAVRSNAQPDETRMATRLIVPSFSYRLARTKDFMQRTSNNLESFYGFELPIERQGCFTAQSAISPSHKAVCKVGFARLIVV